VRFLVTIKDVAEHAGVSIATVSRVINGAKNVSDDTRKKVIKVIKKLGYKPMPSLRNRSELFYTLGVMVPDLKGYHYNEILMAIEEYASVHGFEIMVSVPKMSPEEEKHVLDQYFKRKIDGIILCELFGDTDYLEPFINSGVPIVALDYYIEEILCDSVNIDNVSGARSAMKYLYNMGHRNILYIRGVEKSPASKNREKGIEKFLRKHKDVQVYFSEHSGYNPSDGYEAVESFLKKHGLKFTAIFAVNDWASIGALRALYDHGLRVPDDVSIIGYDNGPFSEYLYPPLTTIHQLRREMGLTAAQLLIERILGKGPKIPRNVVLPTKLIERKSVKKVEP
jgi:LacI family transcriptional regulator